MSTRARRYTTQARVLACLQAVCCLYRLSKNDSSPLSEKKPFYIIPIPSGQGLWIYGTGKSLYIPAPEL